MLQKVSNMDKSSFWAPIVYRKLLSTDKDDRDAAEKCLKDLESILLPPNHSLSQVCNLSLMDFYTITLNFCHILRKKDILAFVEIPKWRSNRKYI